ncbi:hypothetical protein CONLIGDRAFT_214663 [Coniochaeta ligniaria NRRL 30616]|uniref:Lysine-specific metallo-endopeptidase domain-containing protein n=1 Tax=Coniochaeta ligniaria NRRL 30616 TaxID=1408157 RepID=A0A1J7JVY6_9PEZI|nr:hypothetical protein CONLIGDRAFT_214663 [Coniochaeta ligniaria NRRL 30616]
MLVNYFLALATSLWTVAVWAQEAVSIDDIFVVHMSPLEKGGCTEAEKTKLGTWFDESFDMLDESFAALQDYDTNERVQKAATTFFGFQPEMATAEDITEAIKENIGQVSDFMNNDRASPKPHIFCNTDFLERKAPTDPVQDIQGEFVPDPKNPDKLLTIKAQLKSKISKTKSAYWIELIKVYWISEPKWATGFCDDKTQLAVTGDFNIDIMDPKNSKTSQIIIICPQAFTTSEYKDELYKSGIAVGDHIEAWQPKSLTFLHELFHVVHGANMLSGTKEIYGAIACADRALKAKSASAVRKNPETFAFFSMAMYYLQNKIIDFSSLTATSLPESSSD